MIRAITTLRLLGRPTYLSRTYVYQILFSFFLLFATYTLSSLNETQRKWWMAPTEFHRKQSDNVNSRFNTDDECDRQTNRRTDRQTDALAHTVLHVFLQQLWT